MEIFTKGNVVKIIETTSSSAKVTLNKKNSLYIGNILVNGGKHINYADIFRVYETITGYINEVERRITFKELVKVLESEFNKVNIQVIN